MMSIYKTYGVEIFTKYDTHATNIFRIIAVMIQCVELEFSNHETNFSWCLCNFPPLPERDTKMEEIPQLFRKCARYIHLRSV